VRRALAVVVCALSIVLAGCAGSRPPPSLDVGPAQRSSIVEGPFELVFDLPRSTYRAGEAIEGRATLGLVGGAPLAFGSSGSGPFVFDVEELDGRRRVGGLQTADCAPFRLEPGRPMTSAITKSGAYGDDEPEAAFTRDYLNGDPTVTLPAGRWRITAIASLVEGEGCSGTSRNLEAPIDVHVVP
jgi:hypothetical protein